jgi:hypothetical protein
MTIRATIPGGVQEFQRTQATPYYEALAQRFESQAQSNTPRSRMAWGAEQSRLGSWGTGLGAMRQPGVGRSYSNGLGQPLFEMDKEDNQ